MARLSLLIVVAFALALLLCVAVDAGRSHKKQVHHASKHISTTTKHTSALPTPPLWPNAFNATLINLGPDSLPNDLKFQKIYFTIESTRFDSYTSYIGEDQQWIVNSSILMTSVEYEGQVYGMIYNLFPQTSFSNASCTIFSNSLGNIDQDWLKDYVFQSTQMLRGLYVQWWQDSDDSNRNYFNRVDQYSTPVRSTGPAAFPGATDYLDFIEGAQDQSLFEVPSYCPTPVSSSMMTEESSYGEHELINMLPFPFSHHVRSHLNKKSRK